MVRLQRDRWSIVVLVLCFEGSLLGAAWGLGYLLNQPPLEHFSWNARDALLAIPATLPLFLAFFSILYWPIGPLRQVWQLCEEILRPMFAGCRPLDLAVISLLAGVSEELLFRGVLQPVLARSVGNWPALALTSLLFGLMHPITATYAAIAGLFGFYLGYLWLVSGNLLLVIVVHAVYDFGVLAYLTTKKPA
jgi:membrane protease YdiL (CAAX protease family)